MGTTSKVPGTGRKTFSKRRRIKACGSELPAKPVCAGFDSLGNQAENTLPSLTVRESKLRTVDFKRSPKYDTLKLLFVGSMSQRKGLLIFLKR
jgi:hypothetical protein